MKNNSRGVLKLIVPMFGLCVGASFAAQNVVTVDDQHPGIANPQEGVKVGESV